MTRVQPLHPDASYWLKLQRAQKHLRELKRVLRIYHEKHLYQLELVNQDDTKPQFHTITMRTTKKPNPIIGAIVGDCVQNMRSALDHLVVAIAPKERQKAAKFPIETDPIFARLPNSRGYVHPKLRDRRRSFRSALKGVPDPACAFIKQLQPYHGGDPLHPLAIINRLSNRDKHQTLATLAYGLRNPTIVVRYDPSGRIATYEHAGVSEDGAQFHIAPDDLVRGARGDTHVNVNIGGAVRVAISLPGVEGYLDLPDTLDHLCKFTREMVVTPLEQYVR